MLFTGEQIKNSGGTTLVLSFPIVYGDSFSDGLSIDQEFNGLWIGDHFSMDDLDEGFDEEGEEPINDFLKAHFGIKYNSARGMIRRFLLNRED